MPQNSLNFKILRTNENLTSRSGLAFVDAFTWFKQSLHRLAIYKQKKRQPR
ncbi:hypothetical protein [Thermodesulfobacterium hveragerdense]|uniref:hypothetical protein n=1 Tax=Thermodesulfobacterium hveragerdense TaxID=53424 RepID=UPI0003F8BB82|nr:hypothetical protein [Thermodesulfobacterium hveragerdense]